MKRSLAIALFAIICLAAGASAEVPKLLSYQGVLTDAGGVAVSDGFYNITFRIYDVSVGGSAIWTETDAVLVNKGIFNARLGGTTALTSLKFDTTYYLSIEVQGGSELPRQLLASVPYSLNARAVNGVSNVFPDAGNVGIGTLTPSSALEVTNTSGQVGIQFNGNDDYYASIYVNAAQPNATAGYGYIIQGVLRAYTGYSSANTWNLQVGGNYALRASTAGNVSIGSLGPSAERLRVDGGVQLGTSAGTNAGTIRWSGSDFEGYNGSTWQSFTATGTGNVPSGTSGQTLRNNGAGWIATDNLFNDGTHIGIGTTSPTSHLHLQSNGGEEEILVDQLSSTGSAGLRLKTNGGTWDHLMLQKWGPSAGGTIDGISLSNLAIVDAGANGGALMHRVASANPMYFLTGNLERMRITPGGSIGINEKAPAATLQVGGDVFVGSSVANGELSLFRSGVGPAMMETYSNEHGGHVTTYDENGELTTTLEPDYDGEGGYFWVSGGSFGGFEVDGNLNGSGGTFMGVAGPSASAQFDMTTTGDESVKLPADAISSPEILDEPGMSNWATTLGTNIQGTMDAYASQAIFAPADGYVLVIGTADVRADHANGTMTNIVIGVSSSPTDVPLTQNTWLQLPTVLPTGSYHYPVTVSGMFQVTEGVNFFYLDAQATSGYAAMFERNISLIYLPTAYGAFTAPLPELTTTGEKQMGGHAVNQADIAAQRTAAETGNAARVQRELDTMKARLAALEAQMKTGQRGSK